MIQTSHSSDQSPCFSIQNVFFQQGANTILENISFEVHTGDYLGIIGPNGGGKTTLLKIMLGIVKPTKGSIMIFGVPIEKFRQQYILGYVPQRVQQGPWQFPATVEEIVWTGRIAHRRMLRRVTQEDRDAVEEAMDVSDVDKLRSRLIGSLSGGERQRVFIARALAGRPKVLMLDEPTVGVDIATQQQFYTFLKNLRSRYGVTILLVSHDIDVVASEVEYLLCVNRVLVAHSPLKDILKEEVLDQLYGKKIKYIFHGHNS